MFIGQGTLSTAPPVSAPQVARTFACPWPSVQVYGEGLLILSWSSTVQGQSNGSATWRWTGAAGGDVSPVWYKPLWADTITVTPAAVGATCTAIAPVIVGTAPVNNLRTY